MIKAPSDLQYNKRIRKEVVAKISRVMIDMTKNFNLGMDEMTLRCSLKWFPRNRLTRDCWKGNRNAQPKRRLKENENPGEEKEEESLQNL